MAIHSYCVTIIIECLGSSHEHYCLLKIWPTARIGRGPRQENGNGILRKIRKPPLRILRGAVIGWLVCQILVNITLVVNDTPMTGLKKCYAIGIFAAHLL